MWAVDQNHNYKLEWPNQGGVTHTYTVGQSVTMVKVLTREKLSLTLDLLLEFIFDH